MCIKGLKQIFIDVEIDPMVRSVRAIKWIKKDQDKNKILKVKNDMKKTCEVWTRFSKCLQKPSTC